jgi:hypothetical protein
VGQHWTLGEPVREADLTDEQRRAAAKYRPFGSERGVSLIR